MTGALTFFKIAKNSHILIFENYALHGIFYNILCIGTFCSDFPFLSDEAIWLKVEIFVHTSQLPFPSFLLSIFI